jgi:peptide/nickel transport system permease protein
MFVSTRRLRMLRILIKKLVQGLIMLLVVSAITFTLLSAAGGDAFTSMRENPQVSEQTIEELRRVYGLDRPFAVRYASWLGGAATGDLGESFLYRTRVSGLIWSRFLKTAAMSLLAFVISVAVSFGMALLSVLYSAKFLKGLIELIILLTASTPRMVLALFALVAMLQLSLAAGAAGADSPAQLVAGAIVLAVPLISIFLAQLRDALADVMQEDFVRLARAKGLSETNVIVRHALRAAINPFLTIAGLSLGGLLGGSVIVEMVLGWPGLGALTVTAVRARDVPLVMGIVLLASGAVWFGNALAELLTALNDKRVRDGELA